MRNSFVPFTALLAVCIPCAIASADTDPLAAPKDAKAAAHLKQGNRHYRLRDFQSAITEYKAGAAIEEAGVFWYNLGQCYRQLGNYEDALWYYQRFLDRGKPTGALRDSVVDFIAKMTAEKEKAATKQQPTDAGGDENSATTDAKQTTATPAVPAPTQTQEPEKEEPVDAPPRWYADGIGWGITGVGVAGVGIGVGLIVSSSGLADDAQNATNELDRADLHDRADSRRRLGTIVTGVGAAVAVGGIIKLVLVPNRRETAPVVSAAPTSGGMALTISGRF
jgi:tetratricopeptide (TPR) repeat protein